MTEELIDAKDVKRILKCSLPLVYKMADRGQLPCIKIPCVGNGSRKKRFLVRFKKSDVFELVEKHYTST